jgi:ABC-type Fe3+-siderophore transport system permease subunit
MVQKFLSVIAGYAIFVITSLLLFKLSGQDPHADPTFVFVIITIIYGAVFSFIAGFVAQLIARTKNLKVNYILALIIAGFAAFSFFKSTGNHWTQIIAILIFAPVSILGGLFYNKRYNK